MRIIKTKQDLQTLWQTQVFTDTFMDYLDAEFQGLKEAFDFDGLDDAFVLEYGCMVVLERGDNLRDLRAIGLGWAKNGLLGCMPEFIEKNERESESWYKLVVVFSNDDGMIFYVPEGTAATDVEILNWLEENAE